MRPSPFREIEFLFLIHNAHPKKEAPTIIG